MKKLPQQNTYFWNTNYWVLLLHYESRKWKVFKWYWYKKHSGTTFLNNQDVCSMPAASGSKGVNETNP